MSKYTVFKTEELELSLAEQDLTLEDLPEVVDDAVVIRRQDTFAPPALDSYANSILVAVETGVMPVELKQRLNKIANYFHSQAVLSWNNQKRKLPD